MARRRSPKKPTTLAAIKAKLRDGDCVTVEKPSGKVVSLCKLGDKVRERPGST